MSGPLIDALRAATRRLHARVEAASPLARASVPAAGYHAYLTSIAGFHLPLEEELFRRHDWRRRGLTDAPARRRADRLIADLAELGIDPAGLARCPPEDAELASPDAALGALYVLEGSTLGGRALARDLAAQIPPPPIGYLTAAGPATVARWRDFRAFAEAHAARAPDRDAAIGVAVASAVATFDRLARWWEAWPAVASGG